jgi:hypothetical protein
VQYRSKANPINEKNAPKLFALIEVMESEGMSDNLSGAYRMAAIFPKQLPSPPTGEI